MTTKLLQKQLGELAKTDLPNIRVLFGDDMTKIGVTFYYQRSDPKDEEPAFLPRNELGSVMIRGEVDLQNFPNNPPKLKLFGDLPHCHVYNWGDHSIICFSLDQTYQGYFSGKHMRSSRFNPSVSLFYYLKAVYKFLAEDDHEHEISEEKRISVFKYWSTYKIPETEQPKTKLSYQEWLAVSLDDDAEKKIDRKGLTQAVVERYNVPEIPEGVALTRDFVDKSFILLEGEPVVIGVNHVKTGRHIYSIAGLDKMKESIFQTGVRKTSIGVDFNQRLPLVIHSRIWDQTKSRTIFDEMVANTLGKLQAQPIQKIKEKVEPYDGALFILSELFNELAIEVFKGDVFPCEEVLRGFVYLHHILLVLKRDHHDLVNRADQILDAFESGRTEKNECPNLGILMTLYLLTSKKRSYNVLIQEMFTRNCAWSLDSPGTMRGIVRYEPHQVTLPSGKKGIANFVIEDMVRWINKSWDQSHAGMQRFAFQQLYNDRFSGETLESMDAKFGQVKQEEIELFQKHVKELEAWTKLSGRQGYFAFLQYFGMTDQNLEKDLSVAIDASSVAGYDSFTVKKNWGRSKRY